MARVLKCADLCNDPTVKQFKHPVDETMFNYNKTVKPIPSLICKKIYK